MQRERDLTKVGAGLHVVKVVTARNRTSFVFYDAAGAAGSGSGVAASPGVKPDSTFR